MKSYLMLADGMSPHSLKWANELKNSFDLSVVSFSGFSEEFRKLLPEKNLYALQLSVSQKGGNLLLLSAIPAVIRIVADIRPAFVHAHYVTSYGFVAAIVKKVSSVHFSLIMSAWGSDILLTPLRNKLYYAVTRFALKQSELITSDSYYMADCIREMVAKQVMVFPFGVESIPDVHEGEKDDNLLFSNRLLKSNYNVDGIIRFAHNLMNRNPMIRLVVANEGYEKDKLVTLTNSLGISDRVCFVGRLNSQTQAHYYKIARFYISIPSSDSTSVSLLEAMSFGCIPIVSNIPANREWVINKHNGLFFEDTLDIAILYGMESRIFDINREIITKNGLWKDNIIRFVAALIAINDNQTS